MGRKSRNRGVIIADLAGVFRTHGFHGATLSKLVEGSGLERASLYHHFPKGKQDMAKAVLLEALSSLENKVLSTLDNRSDPKQRLLSMIKALNEFYSTGNDLCFITIFSLGEKSDEVSDAMSSAVRKWTKLLTKCLKDMNIKNPVKESQNIISSVQGSLILSNSINDNRPFKNCLYGIKKLLNS